MYEQAALPVQHPRPLHCSPAKAFLPSSKIFRNRVIVGTRHKRPTACTRPQGMRAVLQRVKSASVQASMPTVDGQVISEIGPGLLCLIGVGKDDAAADAEYICRKLLNTRMWPSLENAERAFSSNCVDNGFELLLVSQFTLFGRLKGNKLDFSRAMSPNMVASAIEGLSAATQQLKWLACCFLNAHNVIANIYAAKEQYQQLVERVRTAYNGDQVKDGRFGAMMDVALVNDGPVTINIDSQQRAGGGSDM